jgi:hypothetical protein
VRRGESLLLLPSGADGELEGELSTPVTATPAGVIDARIDVFAQRALLRMAKSPDPAARADASAMLGAVKSGVLAGIYKEDEQVPALRARRVGTSWWLVIPKGQDAAVLREPGAAPLIVFRDSARSNAARLDPALRKAWASLRPAEPRCTILPPADAASFVSAPLAAAAAVVRPKLCLFANEQSQNGAFFRNQAARWARQIGAVANPASMACGAVGATPYDSGAEIVGHIGAVLFCMNFAPLDEVHVFGHSFPEGLIAPRSWAGLYRRDPVPRASGPVSIDRGAGGRLVTDINAPELADEVVFVLHGCSTAQGTQNFARDLFDHLAGVLKTPSVFGHPGSVRVGQRTSWREYSRRSPDGNLTHNTIPKYSGSC